MMNWEEREREEGGGGDECEGLVRRVRACKA